MRRPLVIGHRGFAGRYPENSLAAVKAAVEAGVDGVEVDIRPCREGVWVCHHDRTRNGTPLREWPLAALRQERIPSLAEVVEAVPEDRFLFVEVKPLAQGELLRLFDPLQRLLQPRKYLKVLSSSLRVLSLVQTVLPRATVSWVVDRVPTFVLPGLELSPHHRLVEELRSFHVPLNPWTVNQKGRMQVLAALGVASLTTNFPDRALEVLGA